MHDLKARIVDGGRFGNRLRITVNRNQTPLGAKLGQDQARVSATTESTIDIDTIRANSKTAHGLMQQDGNMGSLF